MFVALADVWGQAFHILAGEFVFLYIFHAFKKIWSPGLYFLIAEVKKHGWENLQCKLLPAGCCK